MNSHCGNEIISPCSCNRFYHKNCILLYLFYSNNIYCESCHDIYNIRTTERYNLPTLLFSQNFFFNFLFYILIILSVSFAIYFIATWEYIIPEMYYEMKIFFICVLSIINLLIIITLVVRSIYIKNRAPPANIYVEDKFKVSSEEDNINNINYENHYSNQNFLTNNMNSSPLNKLNNNMRVNDINNINGKLANKFSKINNIQYYSLKNYSDYNEFFLNNLCTEIFEAKLNFINFNKLKVEKSIQQLNTIKEINDDEFQQNILIKYMDFNSSNSSNDSIRGHKMNLNEKLKSKDNYNMNIVNKNKSKYKNGLKEISNDTPILQGDYSDNESDNEIYYKKLNEIYNDQINNNNKKRMKKGNITQERDSDLNNFNTNINSASGEKFKFSNKDLMGLNVSNINQENLDYYNSNNYEKLILKENINYLNKKTSNSNINRNNINSIKYKSRVSNKDITSVDSYGNSRHSKIDSEGIDYRDFIVTEEKEISSGNHFKFISPKTKLSTGITIKLFF